MILPLVIGLALVTAKPAHTAKLTWKASTDAGTTVNVYRSTTGCAGTFVKLATGVVAAGPYTDTGLSAGTTYSYQITAVLNKLESLPSACVTTPIVPAAPAALALTFK